MTDQQFTALLWHLRVLIVLSGLAVGLLLSEAPPCRRGFLTFGDIVGKLDVLRVECTKCERKGRYSVAKLIAKHGRKGNMMK
jgi:hypothetical protein